MRKTVRIAAVILLVFLLTGCAADTIYIQTVTPTTTAAPATTESTQASTAATELPDDAMVWIPTNGGKKYHKTATCSSMQSPKQVAKEEAEAQGFTPCKRCYS